MPKTAPSTVAPFSASCFLPGLQLSVCHHQQSLPVRSQVYPDLHRQMLHPICHGSEQILPVLFFYHIVRTKRQVICNCFSVFPGRYRCYQSIFCINQLSVSIFIFLIIRCVDIFRCIDVKLCTFQIFFFINKILLNPLSISPFL